MSLTNTDSHGRRRSKTVAFRLSPQEAELLDRLVEASGLSKQDYITGCLEGGSVTIVPNSRMQRGMLRQMDYAYRELRRIRDGSAISPELEALLVRLEAQLAGLGEDIAQRPSEVEKEDAAMRNLMGGR